MFTNVNVLKQQFFSNISPDIGVVNTVAIHILVTDSADTVTALTLKIFVWKHSKERREIPGRWICRWFCGRGQGGRLPGLPPPLASLLLQARTHDSCNIGVNNNINIIMRSSDLIYIGHHLHHHDHHDHPHLAFILGPPDSPGASPGSGRVAHLSQQSQKESKLSGKLEATLYVYREIFNCNISISISI